MHRWTTSREIFCVSRWPVHFPLKVLSLKGGGKATSPIFVTLIASETTHEVGVQGNKEDAEDLISQ